MNTLRKTVGVVIVIGAAMAAGAVGQSQPAPVTYFVGAHLIGRADRPDLPDAVVSVRDGRIWGISPRSAAPSLSTGRVDLTGKFVISGLMSAHAHVSDVNGMKPREYTEENTLRQLTQYARYGVTTVWSLGGEQKPAFKARDMQNTPKLDRARIYVAGEVITAQSPSEARQR